MDDFRQQIPGLQQTVHGFPLVYFDSAATTQVPQCVLDAVAETMVARGNVPRGVHTLGHQSTALYEKARNRIAKFVNGKASEVVITSGTTHGLNMIAHCAGEYLGEGDVVLLSVLEHHAHLLPWQSVGQRKGFHLKCVPIDENGRIDLEELEKLLQEGRVRVVGFPLTVSYTHLRAHET